MRSVTGLWPVASTDAAAVTDLPGDLSGEVSTKTEASKKADFIFKTCPPLENSISRLIPVFGDVLGKLSSLPYIECLCIFSECRPSGGLQPMA